MVGRLGAGQQLGNFYGTNYQIISLKAQGNYFASFWPNKILVLFLERPKPQHAIISGFSDPWDPLYMDLNILKYVK